MNQNMHHNQKPHEAHQPSHPKPLDAPVTAEEMQRMPGVEDRSKRTRMSKIFHLGRNLHQAVLFADPVHYRDQTTGQWQEIDNTLIPRTDAAGHTFLTNRANDELNVEFHDTTDAATVLLQDEQHHLLAWKLADAQEIAPVRVDRPCLEHNDCDLRRDVLAHIEDEVLYAAIFPGVDLRCRIQGLSFKDELVFHALESVRPVTFVLAAPGLHPVLRENGDIDWLASDDSVNSAVFTLPKPFLKDQQPEHATGAVAVALEPMEEDLWRLTMTLDEAWLQEAQFPVVLDPAVITRKHATSIEDNFITSKKPTTVQPYAGNGMTVSYNSSNWGTSKAFIKFLGTGLPQIDSSYYVTKAFFSVMTKSKPTTAASVYLKEVLGDWSSQTLTYQNAPALNDMPLDYTYMSATNTWYTYDISNLVRKWYSGVNYGIALEATTSTYLELYTSDASYKPYVTINYVSLAGLEDYLVYEDQSVGRAGTGHVSLYNGNLIFERQDTSCGGSRMPVSISHVYNSCYRNVTAFGAGAGWKMNIQQTLHKETLTDSAGSTTYYVYMDEDGTRHHFKQISGEWKDQSGKEMKLTLSGSSATLTDKGHNTWVFDLPTAEFNENYANAKLLKRMTDACGNTMTVTANGCVVDSVQDGVGRATGFYNRDGRVDTIMAPGYTESGYCGFSYDANGRMVQVWELAGQPGSEEMHYTYDGNGLLTSVTNCDGVKVTYEYYTTREPFRVKRVRVTGGDIVTCDRTYDYRDCLTVVTDNLSGKQLFYHFNDFGNCVSVNDQLGYACFAKYSDAYPVNHPESISKLQRSVVNLLQNHNFEDESAWGFTNGNTAVNSVGYATDAPHWGTRCVKGVVNDGTRVDMQQWVPLECGKTYTLSYYAKCTGAMCVWLETYNGMEGWKVFEKPPVQQTAAYQRYQNSFMVPGTSGTCNMYIGLRMGGGNGTAWVDNVQLEEGPVANRYNLLINGDFTFNAGAHPTGWNKNSSNTASDVVYTSCTGTKPAGLSANTMRLYGTGRTKYAGIYQDLPLSGKQGDVFVAGGWSMNFSKPRKGEDFRYDIRVAFLKTGTTTRTNTPSIEWSEEWTDWQFAAGPVVAPCDYSAIRFNVDYERNINYAEFGGLFLHKEEFGETYVYDSKGNVVSSKNAASLKDGATYDAFDNILTYYQPGRSSSVKTTLEWGSTDAEKKQHLLRRATSPLGTVKDYTYDTYGNPMTTKTSSSGSGFMQTTTAYSENGNHAVRQTDARGKTVVRNTDAAMDTLLSVTDPRGQTVNYAYDQNRKVTKTTAVADGKEYVNQYTYTKDKLTQVKHNTSANAAEDVTYHFEFDAAGRPTNVKVGSQLLSKTTYNADGTVKQVDYGNEDSIQYTYDAFKRLTGVRGRWDAEDRYVYEYGANGQVARLTNDELSTVSTSEYDAANRPMRIMQKNSVSDVHLYTGEVTYDQYNNLAAFKEQVGADRAAYTTTFTHDNENRPTQLDFGSSRQVAYTYDGLGRVSKRTVNAGGTAVETNYGYLAGGHGTGSTTPLVQTISQNGMTLTYTYDDAGNITSVSDGSKTVSYVYDLLGQLIRANDPYDTTAGESGTTWVYSYDQGGNILSRAAYAFTTDAVGTAMQTNRYVYGDANWKDKLTTYNGKTIPYDAIGNPLSDGNWNLTWVDGRRLRSMYKGEAGQPGYDEITFEYNENGLRTKKNRMFYDSATGTVRQQTTRRTSLRWWFTTASRMGICIIYKAT